MKPNKDRTRSEGELERQMFQMTFYQLENTVFGVDASVDIKGKSIYNVQLMGYRIKDQIFIYMYM